MTGLQVPVTFQCNYKRFPLVPPGPPSLRMKISERDLLSQTSPEAQNRFHGSSSKGRPGGGRHHSIDADLLPVIPGLVSTLGLSVSTGIRENRRQSFSLSRRFTYGRERETLLHIHHAGLRLKKDSVLTSSRGEHTPVPGAKKQTSQGQPTCFLAFISLMSLHPPVVLHKASGPAARREA